ncbi:MAG: hypothetical protein COS43_01920 [Gallionellales bacterium CG03_land_8_20_14_0_80_55_15]|nr:MAG: hypothetical protein COS43_01920 [Gallionellales bacterium CG03_land_8_20_14_0_80_55_15]
MHTGLFCETHTGLFCEMHTGLFCEMHTGLFCEMHTGHLVFVRLIAGESSISVGWLTSGGIFALPVVLSIFA